LAGGVITAPAPTAATVDDTPAPTVRPATPAAPDPAISFSTPQRVLGGQLRYGLDLAVDPGGHVHLVASGLHAGKAGLWYGTDRTGPWVFKRILAWSAGSVWIHPSLAIDAAGRVHIAVEKAGCVECTIAPAKGIWYLSDVGRARGTFPAQPARLTADGTAQPSLRVAGGHVFLAFAGNPDLAFQAVKLRTNASGAWTTTTIASKGTDPSLRLGMNGKPRVVFETKQALKYARAATLTGGWTVETITDTSATDDEPLLSIDENGGTHVLWLDTYGPAGTLVRYGSRVGGHWRPADTVAETSVHALSVDDPSLPWVATGGVAVTGHVRMGGWFQAIPVSEDAAFDVAIKVLDSGDVVLAYAGGDPAGLWISRT
jgi:hypothetical protein